MIMYVVQIGRRFAKACSYGGYTEVNHPAKATLYSREGDASKRLAKIESHIRLMAHSLAGGPLAAAATHGNPKVVKVDISYSIVP